MTIDMGSNLKVRRVEEPTMFVEMEAKQRLDKAWLFLSA